MKVTVSWQSGLFADRIHPGIRKDQGSKCVMELSFLLREAAALIICHVTVLSRETDVSFFEFLKIHLQSSKAFPTPSIRDSRNQSTDSRLGKDFFKDF